MRISSRTALTNSVIYFRRIVLTGNVFGWVFGIYLAATGVATARYENRVDIIENRANTIFRQLSTSNWKKAFSRMARVQHMACPRRPDLRWPKSVLSSLFGRDTVHVEIVDLLRETVETWKDSLAESDLNGVDLFRASLFGASFFGADLTGADLTGADLTGADLTGANLIEADLIEADLIEADLRRADLREADLSGADLSGADLGWADLRRADLREADLSGADLSGADLGWADLREAYLGMVDLSGADLTWADLRGTDLRHVRNLTLVKLLSARDPDNAILDADLKQELTEALNARDKKNE